MSSKFTHLHIHSHYSLLNALPKIPELVETAKQNRMDALALTDNGNLYGAIEFYKACKKENIKPIIGVDAYVAVRTRNDKQAGIDNRHSRLILLAKNISGYNNLLKLITKSNLEGFYYKPRIDKELIENYKDGLVCISPSFSGEISNVLKAGDDEKAESLINWYKKVFGDENFYLEITHHPEISGYEKLTKKIIQIGNKTKTSLVATNNVYYLKPEDKKARDTLTSIQTNLDWSEKSDFEEDISDFSFTSSEQMEKYFSDIPEAIENTRKITNLCNLNIELGKWVFPNIEIKNKSYDDEFRDIVYSGIEKRKLEKTPEMLQRIEYELKVIKDKGYAPYFLVVSDLLRFAHENHILTTIRGSVAGSMVTFLANITNVNPLEYKLPFERFLNPERPSAPDIDMDYADNRRDEMIAYAKQKYGEDKVAQIGTFGTMAARGSVRDVTRALGFPYSLGDQIAKLIPMGSQGFPMTIDKAMEEVPELQTIYKKEENVKTIIDMAKKIEGCARHISVHAAGVVIAPTSLTNYVPLQYDTKGENKIITQYDMYAIENTGLLKFDFLGIKNLAILADSVSLVEKILGKKIDIENISIDDKKTFEMLARGETAGLFQLNGHGMTRYLKELKPTSIHDINAMVALYRPGPLESIPRYIERKHNSFLIEYLDPRMKDILAQSYGVITYQDDVMMIAIKLAGYSWLEADKLRKAMGKKIVAEMEAQKEKFIGGLIKNGMTPIKSQELWKLIEPFAAYGFNKCLTGNTKITDIKSGNIFTIKEIYEKNLKPAISTMNDKFLLEKKSITGIMKNGIKEIWEVKTKSGRIITATSNHPLFTFLKWKNISTIKIGERIAVPRNLSLLLGKKEKATNKTLTYTASKTKDIVPIEILKIIRKIMFEKNISIIEISNKTKLSKRLFYSNKRKIGYQRETINIIGKYLKSEKLLQIANSDIYWDEIISIKKIGKEMTYDITLPPYHNFVANDIIVHNSHAASYGRVAYQTSYMKANFPAIYMAAVLTADSGDVEKIAEIIPDCKRMGISVLPPNINESFGGFTVVKNEKTGNNEIRFGLFTIKNFGEGIGNSIIAERKKGGKFRSLVDFLDRIKDKNLNKKSLEALIKCGAMDELEKRDNMLGNVPDLLAYNKEKNKSDNNQNSLFGGLPESSISNLKLKETPPTTTAEKLAWEKELLGLYISGHPLDNFKDKLANKVPINKIKGTMKEGMVAVVSGIIEEVKPITTQKGDSMAFIRIADYSSTLEIVAFPKIYSQFKDILIPEQCVSIKGKISNRNGSVSILAEAIKKL